MENQILIKEAKSQTRRILNVARFHLHIFYGWWSILMAALMASKLFYLEPHLLVMFWSLGICLGTVICEKKFKEKQLTKGQPYAASEKKRYGSTHKATIALGFLGSVLVILFGFWQAKTNKGNFTNIILSVAAFSLILFWLYQGLELKLKEYFLIAIGLICAVGAYIFLIPEIKYLLPVLIIGVVELFVGFSFKKQWDLWVKNTTATEMNT